MRLSQRVSELCQIPICSTKPLIGKSAFTHTLGAHQWGVRQKWFVYEPIRAEAIGNERHLPLGRLTHHLLVKDKLQEFGISELDDSKVKEITESVRDLAEKEAKFVSDEELLEIWRNQAK